MHSKPLLPTADKILPYLKRIDESRYYTNIGPLALELEKRLSDMFGCGVVTTSSCTAGLTACIMALDLPKDAIICVPSWTFVASAEAIVAAGHIPYFCDVGLDGFRSAFSIGFNANMFVCPFGNVPNGMPLLSESATPFVIDAAGAFDSIKVGGCPVVVSTHATKVFSTGEGGVILSCDEKFLQKVREISNHGINKSREVNHIGINAKMSEYSAAVGLAELDGWPEKKKRWIDIKEKYMEAFRGYLPFYIGEGATSLFPIRLQQSVEPVITKMNTEGIMCRAWVPVHRFKAYKDYPRTPMTATDILADNIMLVPFSIDQTDEQIALIKRTLCESL